MHHDTLSPYNSLITFPLLFQVHQISEDKCLYGHTSYAPARPVPTTPFLFTGRQRKPKRETRILCTVIFLHFDHINHGHSHQRSHWVYIVTIHYNLILKNCISHFKKQKSYLKIQQSCGDYQDGSRKDDTRFLSYIQTEIRVGI